MDYASAPAGMERHYVARADRYARRDWRRAGESGLKLSAITLGTWQNFSDLDPRESVRALYLTAFDNGVFSFDFGNNYGRPPGSAEALFGDFVTRELAPYRHELVIATKAGYDMWPGPNGIGSSAKYLIGSLDESLKRMRLDHVDIFYSHRFDPTTPLAETAEALDFARRSGRCRYVGISSYPPAEARAIGEELARRGTHLLVNQSHYNMLARYVEEGALDACRATGTGFAAFSPLAQGLLSEKYLAEGAGEGRAAAPGSSAWCNDWDRLRTALAGLKGIADRRGQSIPQLALSWVLRDPLVCTAVIGVRTPEQLLANLVLDTNFGDEECAEIARLCEGLDVDLWHPDRTAGQIVQ